MSTTQAAGEGKQPGRHPSPAPNLINSDNLPLRLVGWGRPKSWRRKKEERWFREAWEQQCQ